MTAIIKPPITAGGNLVKTGAVISDGPALATDVEVTAAVAAHAATPHGTSPPTGGAGGVLSGTYPNPGFAVDMATQSELQTEIDRATAQENLKLAKAANLSDLANAATARTNLGAASPADITAAVTALVDASPATLDTLNELANALGDDPNFATTITTALAGKQPLDSDLTAVAGLAPTNDDLLQRKAGAWANRTPAQVKTDLALVKGDVGLGNVDNLQQQPLDSDLTAIAALTTTAFGRTFLDLADAAAARTKLVLGTAAQSAVGDFQPTDADLTAIAALSTTAYGRALLSLADQAALKIAVGADEAVGVASLRKLGTGALEAAPGDSGLAQTVFDRPLVGSWYMPLGTSQNTPGWLANLYLGCWLFVPVSTPVDRLGIEVTVAGLPGDTVRLALYKKTLGSPTLTRIIAETADLSIDSTGLKEATVAVTLAPGRYAAFLRCPVYVGATMFRGRITGSWTGYYPGDATELGSAGYGGIHPSQLTVSSGVFPATLTLRAGERFHAPMIYLRAA